MLHFLLIGIALFGAHRWLSPGDIDGRRVIITQGVVDDLVTQHVAAKGRAPSSIELNDLIDLFVRDEILYREGVRLGLDRDDIVVKRRVRQKIELMAEEDAETRTPTETDLAAYLSAHPDRFRQPAMLTFEQVYLGPADAGPDAVRIVAVTGEALRNGTDPERLGKPTLLAHRMADTPADLVARDFGDGLRGGARACASRRMDRAGRFELRFALRAGFRSHRCGVAVAGRGARRCHSRMGERSAPTRAQ